MKFFVFIASFVLAFAMLLITLRLTHTPSKPSVNPPGENAVAPTTTEPTTTTTTTPETKFVTISAGTNQYGKYMWHGTIDGFECLIYADKMFCKGMNEITNGVTPPKG